MTTSEDEAFIRAIVDSPGDDTPRLVYADWLDEQDDARGPYLRAEAEAVAADDLGGLRALRLTALNVAGLDPVWVARVSRPPVGVCIAAEQITERGGPLTTGDIGIAERKLGVELPTDYIAFLLNYNGGLLTKQTGPPGGIRFYPFVRKPKQRTFADLCSSYRQYRSDYLGRSFSPDESPWHWNYLPIALLESNKELCLGITSNSHGQVYALIHNLSYNPSNAHELAASLAAFLAM